MEKTVCTAWNGTYKGIPYEINKFKLGNKDAWTFYLFLREKQIPDVFDSLWLDDHKAESFDFWYYDYEETLIGNLDWHGGCTYYRKVSGFDHEQRVIKVGCDYQHYFDEGQYYSEDLVEEDVKDCINSLYRYVSVLQWCSYCGNFVKEVNEKTRCKDCEDK